MQTDADALVIDGLYGAADLELEDNLLRLKVGQEVLIKIKYRACRGS